MTTREAAQAFERRGVEIRPVPDRATRKHIDSLGWGMAAWKPLRPFVPGRPLLNW